MTNEQIEKQITKLKSELTIVNKRKKFLDGKIKSLYDSLEKTKYDPSSEFVRRDVDLLIDYIISTGRTISSSELIKYVNLHGYIENKRWSGFMDGNRFMNYLGNHMKKRSNISTEKIGALTYWYCNV